MSASPTSRKSYPSDLSDEQWEQIRALIPVPPQHGPQHNLYGAPNLYSRREVINAIRYILRTGCPWRYLPHDFPPWDLVYSYFQTWTRNGTWERVHDVLRRRVRKQAGKRARATAGSLDSQSVPSTATGGGHGYDAGKKTKGRKRHLLVDTLGLLVTLVISSASMQDRDGGVALLRQAANEKVSPKVVWVDKAYRGPRVRQAANDTGVRVEMTSGGGQGKGFMVASKRWVVERSFGWLHWDRRLGKDYERTEVMAASFVRASFIGVMLRRLARENYVTWRQTKAA